MRDSAAAPDRLPIRTANGTVIKLTAFYQKLSSARRFLRFKPFDTSTPQGRSDERYRRVVLTTFTSVLAKCAAMLSLLVSVPLTIHYLGAERYGIWMTISSIVAMLSSADLGIGYGLMNMVAESFGKDDQEASARYVSSGFFALLGVAITILIGAVLVYPHIEWQKWFNVTSPMAVREAGPTLLVLVACVAVNIPLNVTQRVQLGFQEGYIANLWNILGQLIGLAGVLVCVYARVGLPWLVFAVAGAPAIAALLNTCYTFLLQRQWLRPRVSMVTAENTKRLLGLGILFFLYQMTQVVGFQSDNVVIAHILGAGSVPVYAVTSRMFSVVFLLMSFVIAPLWPAYGEALARGDIAWLRRTLFRSIALVLLICVPINLALVLGGKWILLLWVGPKISPSLFLLAGIGISQTLMVIVTPLAAFLNGLNLLGRQVIFASLMAITNICASVYLTRRIGVPGVIYGSVIAELLFFVGPFILLVRHALATIAKDSEGKSSVSTKVAYE